MIGIILVALMVLIGILCVITLGENVIIKAIKHFKEIF